LERTSHPAFEDQCRLMVKDFCAEKLEISIYLCFHCQYKLCKNGQTEEAACLWVFRWQVLSRIKDTYESFPPLPPQDFTSSFYMTSAIITDITAVGSRRPSKGQQADHTPSPRAQNAYIGFFMDIMASYPWDYHSPSESTNAHAPSCVSVPRYS
jgi:hypothetical protein